MPKFFTFSGFFSKICARAHGARGGQYRSCRAPRANPSRQPLALPSPQLFAAADGCVRCPACPLLNRVAPLATHCRAKAQRSGRRTSLHAMISPFMRLIRLNCLMKYQNLLFARTCGTRRPTLASARGDRRSARAFSPPRAACQTTALSFRKPGIPVHPRPGQSPGRQRRQLPRSAPLKMCGLEKARRRARTSSSANTFIRKILGFGFLSVGTCRPTTCHRCIPILPRRSSSFASPAVSNPPAGWVASS